MDPVNHLLMPPPRPNDYPDAPRTLPLAELWAATQPDGRPLAAALAAGVRQAQEEGFCRQEWCRYDPAGRAGTRCPSTRCWCRASRSALPGRCTT